LNEGGLRVDSKEAQGLFNKTSTAEGVSSNLGRRISIERFGPNLVRTVRSARRGSGQVRSGSDRSNLTERGRRRGGGVSPEIGFRGGAPLELGEINAPGVKSNGAWVCRDQRDTRDPPEALVGLGVVRDCTRGDGSGFARWSSPACGIPTMETG
jgi:hypothetical protein